MSKEIIEILDYVGAKFGLAIDWTDKNVLPYIKELAEHYIDYELWTSTMCVIVCMIIMFICVRTLKRKWRLAIDEWDDESIAFCTGSIILIIFILVITGFEIVDIVKCITFPEMQIYEYLSGLMKK